VIQIAIKTMHTNIDVENHTHSLTSVDRRLSRRFPPATWDLCPRVVWKVPVWSGKVL